MKIDDVMPQPANCQVCGKQFEDGHGIYWNYDLSPKKMCAGCMAALEAPFRGLERTTLEGVAISEILTERERQDRKWGSGRPRKDRLFWLAILSEEIGEAAKEVVEIHSRRDAPDPALRAKLRAELVQSAAVAVHFLRDLSDGNFLMPDALVLKNIAAGFTVPYFAQPLPSELLFFSALMVRRLGQLSGSLLGADAMVERGLHWLIESLLAFIKYLDRLSAQEQDRVLVS